MPPDGQPERLQKVIARSGFASRRQADAMVVAGRVLVDGLPARAGQRIHAGEAEVLVDGLPLPTNPALEYYLLNKPVGVVSTTSDPHARSKVIDLVPTSARLFSVGRLDADSSGLIILTNDGTFANLVSHPRYGITKTYRVLVRGRPKPVDLERLVKGIRLDDGLARATSVRIVGVHRGRADLEMVMAEGRNREVRRLCATLGYHVEALHRVAIGRLSDPTLGLGEWRVLHVKEIRMIHELADRDNLPTKVERNA